MKFCLLLAGVLLAYVLLLTACTDEVSSQRAKIDKAEEALRYEANDAIPILFSIDHPEALPDSLRARYALLLGEAHHITGQILYEDSLLPHALSYYQRPEVHNNSQLLEACRLTSRYHYENGRYEKAVQSLLFGDSVAALSTDTAARINLLSYTMYISEGNTDIHGMLRLYKQLVAVDHNPTRLCRNYNSLALAYCYAGQKDSSLLAFRQASEHIPASEDSALAGRYVLRNQADIMSHFGQDREAIDLQRRILQKLKATDEPAVFESYLSLSRYYLNLGRMDSARYFMQQTDSTYLPYIEQDPTAGNYYLIHKELMKYVDSHSFSIVDIAFFTNKLYASFLRGERKVYTKDRTQLLLQQQNINLQLEKQKERTLFVGLISFCILLLFAVIWNIQRRKRLLVEKEEELEALRRLQHEAEEENGGRNDKFVKKMLLQQLGLIRIVATSPSADHQELLVQMGRIANKDIVADDLLVWSDIYKTIDLVYNGFYSHISRKYAGVLNEKELQLCCLLRSDFSTKEISVVTQQSIRTVYQRKTVVRQKLGMEEKEDISGFLSKDAEG